MKRNLQINFSFFAMIILLMVFNQNCSKGFEVAEMAEFNSSSGSLFNPDAKGGNPFVCSNPNQPAASPLRRLTRTQYSNTLLNAVGPSLHMSLTGSIATLYDDVLAKSVSDFRTQIEDAQMQAYQSVAEKAYFTIQATPTLAVALAGACLSAVPVTSACKTDFVRTFGKKMFRRPLLDSEVNKFTSQVFEKGESATEGVAMTVYAMMISPDFLLRLELGSSTDPTAANVFNLSPYEVASRLSYLLWDAPPDEALMLAADSNRLSNSDQLSAETDRMLKDPRAKSKIHDFFRFWVDPKKSAPTAFSTDFLNGFDVSAANAEFEREMYEFIDYVVFQKNGSFKDLLADSSSFARTNLVAQTYGHAAVTGTSPAQMDSNRKGLLMRAPVIATEGNETHPILRGVKFKRRFLCDTLGLPSGVMTNDPTFFSDSARMVSSTRARTAGLTSSSTCMACHSSINPFGFALENFDGLGRLRLKEKSYSTMGNFLAEFPIDTRVSGLAIELGSSFSVNDGTEMIDHMLEGNKVPACFVQQIYRYYQMKAETPGDGCQLSSMYDKLKTQDNSGKPLLSVFKELFVYPSVLKRSLQ
jgi:hypothetical protein